LIIERIDLTTRPPPEGDGFLPEIPLNYAKNVRKFVKRLST